MTNSFSEELRQEALPIWDSIFAHPFLEEIEAATLPIEKFRYYVEQDYHYLAGFGAGRGYRAVQGAGHPYASQAHAPDYNAGRASAARQDVRAAGDERGRSGVGRSLSHQFGVHQPHAGRRIDGGVGEAAAALLPCPWTYHEIGMRIAIPEHPVYSYWAEPYREGLLEESTAAWRELVDEFAANGGPAVREAMRSAFITSSRYEFMFWSMAYGMERWPV